MFPFQNSQNSDSLFNGYQDAMEYINTAADPYGDYDDDDSLIGLKIATGQAPKLTPEKITKIKKACQDIMALPIPTNQDKNYVNGRNMAVNEWLKNLKLMG